MSNRAFPIMLAFSTILMSACSLGFGGKEKVAAYHELYDRFPTRRIFKMPANHTKAHYGYTENDRQGHHSWYYGQYTKQGFVEVPYNEKKQEFTNSEVRLNGAFMEGGGATRCWIAKYSGRIVIDGSLSLKKISITYYASQSLWPNTKYRKCHQILKFRSQLILKKNYTSL